MASNGGKAASRFLEQLPTDQLKQELRELAAAAGQRAAGSLTGRATKARGRLVDLVKGSGKKLARMPAGRGAADRDGAERPDREPPQRAGQQPAESERGEAGGGSGGSAKVTNIVEEIDVGVPVPVAYNQWTRFTDFPEYMKKVEKVEQESDTELTWRAQILWSHREWRTTIIDQVPDQRIVWKSEGAKGHVGGAVTFHEISPNLTRILLVLQYYPQGLFEKTGNLWRAQGRRARLELKHFRRHVMTEVLLNPDAVEGWRGEIRDGAVAGGESQDGPG